MVTSPETTASGAIHALGWILGRRPPCSTYMAAPSFAVRCSPPTEMSLSGAGRRSGQAQTMGSASWRQDVDQLTEPADLLRGVVVVHGGAHDPVEPSFLQIQPGVLDQRDFDAHVAAGQCCLHLLRGDAGDAKGDDPAALLAAVVLGDPRDRYEVSAQRFGQFADAGPDVVEAEVERVVDRTTEAEPEGVRGLPRLEPPRVLPELVGVEARPLSTSEVEERRMKPLDPLAIDVEEAGPPRPTKEFSAGRREEVATDLRHVDRHLPHRLTGVEQEGDPGFAGQASNVLGRIDQPAARGNVRQGDQLRSPIDPECELVDIDLTLVVVRNDDDPCTGRPGQVEIRHVIAGVLGPSGQDPISG